MQGKFAIVPKTCYMQVIQKNSRQLARDPRLKDPASTLLKPHFNHSSLEKGKVRKIHVNTKIFEEVEKRRWKDPVFKAFNL